MEALRGRLAAVSGAGLAPRLLVLASLVAGLGAVARSISGPPPGGPACARRRAWRAGLGGPGGVVGAPGRGSAGRRARWAPAAGSARSRDRCGGAPAGAMARASPSGASSMRCPAAQAGRSGCGVATADGRVAIVTARAGRRPARRATRSSRPATLRPAGDWERAYLRAAGHRARPGGTSDRRRPARAAAGCRALTDRLRERAEGRSGRARRAGRGGPAARVRARAGRPHRPARPSRTSSARASHTSSPCPGRTSCCSPSSRSPCSALVGLGLRARLVGILGADRRLRADGGRGRVDPAGGRDGGGGRSRGARQPARLALVRAAARRRGDACAQSRERRPMLAGSSASPP